MKARLKNYPITIGRRGVRGVFNQTLIVIIIYSPPVRFGQAISLNMVSAVEGSFVFVFCEFVVDLIYEYGFRLESKI
jgi:hypothetical protein